MNFIDVVFCWIMVKVDMKVLIRQLSDAFFYIIFLAHDHHSSSLICFLNNDVVIILEMKKSIFLIDGDQVAKE